MVARIQLALPNAVGMMVGNNGVRGAEADKRRSCSSSPLKSEADGHADRDSDDESGAAATEDLSQCLWSWRYRWPACMADEDMVRRRKIC